MMPSAHYAYEPLKSTDKGAYVHIHGSSRPDILIRKCDSHTKKRLFYHFSMMHCSNIYTRAIQCTVTGTGKRRKASPMQRMKQRNYMRSDIYLLKIE